MSEGVFLLPRIADTADGSSTCKQYARTTVFGTAGVVLIAKPGRLYKAAFTNKHATDAYFVQLHNKATAPLATEACIWEERIPASATGSGGSLVMNFDLSGLYFSAGISFAFSTTQGVLTLGGADGTAYALYAAKTS